MDIYIVMDRDRVVGASARLQGAELIRTEEATREASDVDELRKKSYYNYAYDRMRIVNTHLRDLD